MRRWLWLVGLLASLQVVAETQYWVSVGSFKKLPNAEQNQLQANERLADAFSIEAAKTSRGLLYRVMSGPFLSQETARRKAAQARKAGFTGAWVLAAEAPVSVNLAKEDSQATPAERQTSQPAVVKPATQTPAPRSPSLMRRRNKPNTSRQRCSRIKQSV